MALKVLPDVFTSAPDRLGRFEREAKVLNSLNHPNICDRASTPRVVDERLDGDTLRAEDRPPSSN